MSRRMKRNVRVSEVLRESLARLGAVYSIDIRHVPAGQEWYRVGDDLTEAMEDAKAEMPVSAEEPELVEA